MSELRIREAVRALVIDPAQRVLLVRFEFPAATRWAMPGGGLETGESHDEALRRELAEEVGLVDPTIGPHIWSRLHVVPFLDGSYDGQREHVHLVPTEAFEPRPQLSWPQLNAEFVFELRWWTLDEIATSEAQFAPRHLGALLRALIDDGPPNSPIDVSV